MEYDDIESTPPAADKGKRCMEQDFVDEIEEFTQKTDGGRGYKRNIQQVENPESAPPATRLRPRPRPRPRLVPRKVIPPQSDPQPISVISNEIHHHHHQVTEPYLVLSSSPPSSHSAPLSLSHSTPFSPPHQNPLVSSPSHFYSAKVLLDMHEDGRMESDPSLVKSEESILHALAGLADTCLLCWLKTDQIQSGHTSAACHMEERTVMVQALSGVKVPVDWRWQWMCPHCLLPMNTFTNFEHGSGSQPDKCDFRHILRPLIWACWHFDKVRRGVVANFRPCTPHGIAITGIEDWLEFFQWCFLPNVQVNGSMNHLALLLWACERSAWFMILYPNFNP